MAFFFKQSFLGELGFFLTFFNSNPIYFDFNCFFSNHSIFHHNNFIGCFLADKIKMCARKYFGFNIPVYKNMAEESSCNNPYHEAMSEHYIL